MIVQNLKMNGVTNPLGFLYEKLLCSWKVTDTTAKKQTNAKIEVADNAGFEHAIVAAEGDLASNETEISLDLKPYTTYYWRVTVTGENGECATSEPATFETAKLEEPWTGKWIAPAAEDTYQAVFRKKISFEQPVKRARLYICGLGLFEAYINGEKLGNEFLAPFLNDYEDCFEYCTYDATDALKKDNDSELSVMLGDGWYKGVFGLKLQNNNFGDRLCMIAELRVEFEDGSVQVISSDDSWEYKGSDVEASGIYLGETFNRQLYADKDNPFKKAVYIDAPLTGKLVARYSAPIVIKETIAAKEIIHTPAGETVIDFGQNHAGFMSFEAKNFPAGTKVTFECAEILQDGNFYHDNYRDAESKFVYVSDGRDEYVRPHFTFFGYRYLKVTGWPGELKLGDVTANVIYSDLERIGFIETSNEKINRLYQNCLWGQKSNFIDIPTDCPQRSERLGWTGDTQVFTPTACYNMDSRVFYHKFYKDVYSDQMRAGGAVASFIPSFGEVGGSSIWGDVATMSPDAVLKAYGNIKEMELFYPMMKEWVEWMYRKDENDEGGARKCISRFTFGDWLGLDGITEQSFKGGTEDDMLNHAYYYWSTKITAEMAERIGKAEDAKRYFALAEEIKDSFLSEYFTPNGLMAQDTQASYIVALKFGLYRDRNRLIEQFRKRLKKDCYDIKCGFVGAPLLCMSLCENGMEDLAYEFLFKEGFPSWLYCVNLGATTIWERWNSLLPDGTCSGTGMNSFNHYSYGSVVEFMYAYIGGIRTTGIGYKQAMIAPKPNMRFRYFYCSYDSAYGKYVSNWEIKEDGTFCMHVEVPFNCTAQLILPRYQGEQIHCNQSIAPDENGQVIIEAGSYDISYAPKNDFRYMIGANTRLSELERYPAAMEILKENMPNVYQMAASKDKESGLFTLGELPHLFFMGIDPVKMSETNKKLFKVNCFGA